MNPTLNFTRYAQTKSGKEVIKARSVSILEKTQQDTQWHI